MKDPKDPIVRVKDGNVLNQNRFLLEAEFEKNMVKVDRLIIACFSIPIIFMSTAWVLYFFS